MAEAVPQRGALTFNDFRLVWHFIYCMPCLTMFNTGGFTTVHRAFLCQVFLLRFVPGSASQADSMICVQNSIGRVTV